MRKNLYRPQAPCPCGSGETYARCCGMWHAGLDTGSFAPTPEALMRARYSAYVLGEIGYLLATWHPSTAPGDLELSPIKWIGLEVLHAQASRDAGVVEFVARHRSSRGATEMHEISRFVREGECWYYVDGQIMQSDPHGAG